MWLLVEILRIHDGKSWLCEHPGMCWPSESSSWQMNITLTQPFGIHRQLIPRRKARQHIWTCEPFINQNHYPWGFPIHRGTPSHPPFRDGISPTIQRASGVAPFSLDTSTYYPWVVHISRAIPQLDDPRMMKPPIMTHPCLLLREVRQDKVIQVANLDVLSPMPLNIQYHVHVYIEL